MSTQSFPTGYEQSKNNASVYKRPLALSEVPMVHAINAPRPFAREPVRIHIFAEIDVPDSRNNTLKALRSAWSDLRRQEPDIATTFDPSTMEKVYEVPDERGWQTWLDRTFLVSNSGESVDEIVRLEQQRTELLPVCRIIPAATTIATDASSDNFKATILLLFSHWRTEASGVYMLLDRLLTSAINHLSSSSESLHRQTKPGSELHLLTPPPEAMLMLPSTTSDPIKSRIRTRIDAHASKLPSLELPTIASPSTPTGPVQVHRLVFSPASTTAFLRACKAASPNVSVTSASLAAYLLAIWPLLPSNTNKNFASVMPAQIRSRLPTSTQAGIEIYKSMGCWNAAQFLLLNSPSPGSGSSSDTTFIDRVRGLNEQMSLANDPKWLSEEYTESALQINDLLAKIPAGTGAAPWFTSLGDLERGSLLRSEYTASTSSSTSSEAADAAKTQEKKEKKIEVGQVYGWADPVGMGTVLTVWTWKGRMNWQIQWNGAYHDREMVRRILKRMKEVVDSEEGLGVGKGECGMVVEEEVENEY